MYRIEANPADSVSSKLSGVTQFDTAEILSTFKSKPGQILDYTRLFNDVNTIPDAYLSRKGIMYADVTDLKDVTVHDGNVAVQVREFHLGDVVIEGVKGATADAIRRTFKIPAGELITPG